MSARVPFRSQRPQGKTRRVQLHVECLESRVVPSGGPGGPTAPPTAPTSDVANHVDISNNAVNQPSLEASHGPVNQPAGNQLPSGTQPTNGSQQANGGGPSSNLVTVSGPGYPQVPIIGPVGTGVGNPVSTTTQILIPIQSGSGVPPSLALSPVLVVQSPGTPPKPGAPVAPSAKAKAPIHPAGVPAASSSASGSASASAKPATPLSSVGFGSGSGFGLGSSSASSSSAGSQPTETVLAPFGSGSSRIVTQG